MPVAARFTPSLLDGETLEALFVAREHILADCVARIERAASSAERSARLLVGPRGAGKTHLISLVHHRAKALDGFGTRFHLAWLAEDQWTIGSFDDLVAEILAALEPPLDDVSGPPLAVLQQAVSERGPVVVLIENLDQVLSDIGRNGQERLRALIENHGALLLIATTTRLTDPFRHQTAPFYGYFDTTTLKPFGVDDAVAMLQAIARRNGDRELDRFLDTPAARKRLAAVAHLAGGQPRVWALLASGLTVAGLDELVETLIERFDDLTPYYQEQLRHLSTNERKVVRHLADIDGAVSVRDLATATNIAERSLSKTMGELRKRGWVKVREGPIVALADKRLTFYELAEPLARLAFQLKESRGAPIRLVVDFLKLWFDDTDPDDPSELPGMAGRYLDAAQRSRTLDPSVAVSRILAGGGSSWTDPTTSLFAPLYVPPNAEATATELLALDDAVGAFVAGDPGPLLARPSSIGHLVEDALETAGSVDALRVAIARLAVEIGDPDLWLERIESYVAALAGDDRRRAEQSLVVFRLRVGDDDAAASLLDRSLRDAPIEERVWLGRYALRLGAPELAAAIVGPPQAEAAPDTARQSVELALIRQASLHRLGRSREVGPLWADLADKARVSFGVDHPDTLYVRQLAAQAAGNAGRVDEAARQLRTLVDDEARILGPDDPVVLTTRSNLAYWLAESGRISEATSQFRAILQDRIRTLGPDHPDTLLTRNNLASVLGAAGRTDEAIDRYRALLEDRIRILGPDHPDTLLARNNLASWLGRSGRAHKAADECRSVLQDRIRILGPDHPDTLTTRANLAHWLGEIGQIDEAVVMLQGLLDDRIRVLGPDHPDVLQTRSNLMSWRGENRAESPTESVATLEMLLDHQTRILGPDHPDTFTTRNNLAHALSEAGSAAKAIDQLQDLIEDQTRVLGPDHPDTLTARNNVAELLRRSGRVDEAAIELRTILDRRTQILGPDHPDVLISRNNVASLRGEVDGPQEAVGLYRELLDDSTRILGPDHPDTLTTRNNFAHWLGRAGAVAEAIEHFEALSPDQVRILGPNHPDTALTRTNLAAWLAVASRFDEAIAQFEAAVDSYQHTLGDDHPHTKAGLEAIAQLRTLRAVEGGSTRRPGGP